MVCAAAWPAWAQNAAAAEALFNKGLGALKANDYDTACPLLEESYRLDPKPGALFTLAACEDKRGRVATALTRYEDYLEIVASMPPAQRTRQAARERAAKRERDALKGKVPTLTIVLPESASSVVVKRDGEPIGRPAFGVPLPVDPGEHVVTVHSGDEVVLTERVVIGPGEARTVDLPGSYKTKSASGTPGGADPPPPGDDPPEDAADERMSIAFPIAAFAVGVTGIGIGSVFGVLAIDKKRVVDDDCTGTNCRSEDGKSAGETGRTFATVSTVGFVIGSVGLAAGVTLLLVRGSQSNPTSTGAARPAAAGVRWMPDVLLGPSTLGAGARGTF
jgi:hypothetical protein